MVIKELTIGTSRTINLGNFESLRVEATATCAVEEGDDLDACRVALVAEVRAGLEKAFIDQKKGK
jgi:hypothetical protein